MIVYCYNRNCKWHSESGAYKNPDNNMCYHGEEMVIGKNEVDKIGADNKSFCASFTKKEEMSNYAR